jgi:gamma-glutamyltranspeptidase / glutathione hydrolase
MKHASKRVLSVLMLSCILASCGGEPTGSETTPPEADAGRTTTGGQTTPVAGVAKEATAKETTGREAKAQSGAAEEPELREGPASSSTPTRPALGTNGMVSSAHPLATRAGLEVLEDGGNAYDAAVAIAASLGVVEPYMSGVGGYGAMVIYDAQTGRTRSLSAATRVPETLDPAVFRPPAPGYLENRQGAPAISTPGAVNDWEALWEEYGELRWERLLEPAIRQAEEGFILDEENAGWIGSEFYTFPPHAQEIYGDNGKPLVAGQRLVQEDLGRSLRRISEEGADAVYGGELGEAMASEAQRNGGFLTTNDLDANRPEWQEPISVDYRGNEVVTSPTPTTSWNALTRLGVMSRLDPEALGHNTVAYLDTYATVTRRAYYERFEYAADPEVARTPLDLLLSEDYWEQQAAAVEDSSANPSASSSASTSSVDLTEQRGHTTHFVVADGEGNVVSMTQTLGNIFGSKVMPEGTGIWLNNSISYSQFEPEGNPLDVFPRRHRLVGIAPTIIMREGRPRIALGSHGGYYILQTTPQMIMNLIDFDMDVQQAIAVPRISFTEPNSFAVDASMPASVQGGLEATGHDVYVDEYGLGNAHGLTVEYGQGEAGEPTRFTGGADPRAEGIAIGY